MELLPTGIAGLDGLIGGLPHEAGEAQLAEHQVGVQTILRFKAEGKKRAIR